jgi:NAD(P)-dependent dehydrogenase (short-subunit alcohol dehydrogenase family)
MHIDERPGQLFDLTGRVAIITGGAGMLGPQHGAILAAAGAHVVLLDLSATDPAARARELEQTHERACLGVVADVTEEASLQAARDQVLSCFGRIDILINNAANNPKVLPYAQSEVEASRLETLPLGTWNNDLGVGLTGAFLSSRTFGAQMVKQQSGVIVNVASDLALIAPDQRLYRVDGLPPDRQPVKPVSYSVVKSGLIGLTRYLAAYWASDRIRVNAISPGAVLAGQPEEFTTRLHQLIPLGRMARRDEYQGAILFLCSDASSYMTGANLVVDGGRTCV